MFDKIVNFVADGYIFLGKVVAVVCFGALIYAIALFGYVVFQ